MKFLRVLLLLFCLLPQLAPTPSLARAGGGGGSSEEGGSSSSRYFRRFRSYGGNFGGGAVVVVLGIVGLVLAGRPLSSGRKQRQELTTQLQARDSTILGLTGQLGQRDALWNFQAMEARVREVFFKVQQAWAARDQSLARDCLSDALYDRQKAKTDQLLAENTQNVLEDIQLGTVLLYSLADYHDDSRDCFAVQLTGSMIDYKYGEVLRQVLEGDPENAQEFTEAWFFVRQHDQWVLDRIEPKASEREIQQGIVYVQDAASLARPPAAVWQPPLAASYPLTTLPTLPMAPMTLPVIKDFATEFKPTYLNIPACDQALMEREITFDTVHDLNHTMTIRMLGYELQYARVGG